MASTARLKPLARAVLGTQSDVRLVALARGGSEEAFAEIVRRHRPGLLRFARSLGSGERSEDVVQDSLVRAWRALRSSEAEIDLRPWLTTIVRNRALSAHATVRNHEQLDEAIDGVRQPGDIALLHEELHSAVSAVNSLPAAQRRALVRSALDGESHERIAAELSTTPGAVRQLIFRARTGLRDGLGALIPLPAVRGLIELTGQGTAAGGAATGSVAAIAAGGGGSVALKAVAVVVFGAAVAGSGVALEHRHGGGGEPATAAASTVTPKAAVADTGPPGSAGDGVPAAAASAVAGADARPATASGRPPSQGLAPASSTESGGGEEAVAGSGDRDGSSRTTDAPPPATAAPPPPEHHDGVHQDPGPGSYPSGSQTTQQPPPPPPPDGAQQPLDGQQTQTSGFHLDGYPADGRDSYPRTDSSGLVGAGAPRPR
jgi:RNA polymerase sigma-70 factor (ECF subfamily)